MGGRLTVRQFLMPFIFLLVGVAGVLILNGLNPLDGLLNTTPKESSEDLRSREEIEQSLRGFENQTQPSAVEPSEPVVDAEPTPRIVKQEPGLSEAELQALRDIQERLAQEDARRRERKLAAEQAPLGESIHSIADIKNKASRDTVPSIQEPNAQRILPPALPISTQKPLASLEPATALAKGHHFLSAGSIIPAALTTEIRSELPGLIKAQVTEDVFDTLTGYNLLIPRGSMLLGSYGESTASGQSRLFVYWTRLMYPDGRFIDLGRTGGVDADGASGLVGKRQTGFLSALLGATLINLAQNAGQTDTTSSDLAQAAQAATGTSIGTVTSRYLEDRFNRGPRFTIKAGTIANVMLETDQALPAWGPR